MRKRGEIRLANHPRPGPEQTRDLAELFVQAFFDAFDRRDVAGIEGAFLQSAKIIHDDGVTTDIPAVLSSIRNAAAWPPRQRTLSQFEITPIGDKVVLVGCLNRVTFRPAGCAPTEFLYSETWVLEQTQSGLKAVRCHYSRVTQAEHSEDMQ